MPKLSSASGKEVIKVFQRIGYRVVRQRGSHIRLHHPKRKPLTVPDHNVLGKGLLRKLLRDSEISIREFTELLRKR